MPEAVAAEGPRRLVASVGAAVAVELLRAVVEGKSEQPCYRQLLVVAAALIAHPVALELNLILWREHSDPRLLEGHLEEEGQHRLCFQGWTAGATGEFVAKNDARYREKEKHLHRTIYYTWEHSRLAIDFSDDSLAQGENHMSRFGDRRTDVGTADDRSLALDLLRSNPPKKTWMRHPLEQLQDAVKHMQNRPH